MSFGANSKPRSRQAHSRRRSWSGRQRACWRLQIDDDDRYVLWMTSRALNADVNEVAGFVRQWQREAASRPTDPAPRRWLMNRVTSGIVGTMTSRQREDSSMSTPLSSDTAPGEAAALVCRWAHDVCSAPSASTADLARLLTLDPKTAERLGRQLIFPPSDATSHLEFVLGPDEKTVIFIELATNAPLTIGELTETLGVGREAPPGPHQIAPTIIFDDLWPPDAARGCSVLARVTADYPQPDTVKTVVLYVQTRPSAEDTFPDS
jgi:hypothetical protein